MTLHNILLVDDEGEALVSLSRALKACGLTAKIHATSNPLKAVEILNQEYPQVCVVDLSLDPSEGVESGFRLIQEILDKSPTARVIVLTGHGSIEYGVRALQLGAANFLEKPADLHHLTALINDGIRQSELRRSYDQLKILKVDSVSNSFVGLSDLIIKVQEDIRYAASNNQSVLITGETGTGKGLSARTIHELSSRSNKPFVRYQPTFGSSDLVNSDLFGHIKGSFTGASEDRRGLLLEAQGGTLFLDEIDELPLETQVALLGVLQERKIRPLGSNKEIAVDFRLICAANQNIEKSLQTGKLRQDFYHRIAHFTINIPPLRERREDIDVLSERIAYILREREGGDVQGFEDEALKKLATHDWPGNVRELEAVVEGAIYRAQYEKRLMVSVRDIIINLPISRDLELKGSFHELVHAYKLKLINEKLLETEGNQLRAAVELGLDRSTLRRLLLSK